MIEIINYGISAFIVALGIYALFSSRKNVDLAFTILAPIYLIYKIGFHLGAGDNSAAVLPLIILISFIAITIYRIEKSNDVEQRSYTRKELIIAKKIYDQNCLSDPEGFQPTQGTQEDAEVSIDYLLGIIEADSEKYRKVKYGTPI